MFKITGNGFPVFVNVWSNYENVSVSSRDPQVMGGIVIWDFYVRKRFHAVHSEFDFRFFTLDFILFYFWVRRWSWSCLTGWIACVKIVMPLQLISTQEWLHVHLTNTVFTPSSSCLRIIDLSYQPMSLWLWPLWNFKQTLWDVDVLSGTECLK